MVNNFIVVVKLSVVIDLKMRNKKIFLVNLKC